jgi:hypothetical protein
MPIRADVKVINSLAKRLAAASADGRKELQRAASTMRRNSKPTAGRIIRSKYTVKVGPLNARLRAELIPNEYAVDLGVTKLDLRRRIPIEDFTGTRVTRKGVIASTSKANPPALIPRSYVSTGGKSEGRKMRRIGGDRYPIRIIGGLSASEMLFNKDVTPKVVEALLIRAGKEVARRLANLEKK